MGPEVGGEPKVEVYEVEQGQVWGVRRHGERGDDQ